MTEKEAIKEIIESLEILYKATGDTINSLKETQKEILEPPTILYVCDRRKCKECNDFCTHTTDITHAENFKLVGDNIYFEKEPTTGSLEMKIDTEQFESFMKALFKNDEKPVESEWPYKEVKRPAKKGEYIKIVDKIPLETRYKNGDVFQVNDAYSSGDLYIDTAVMDDVCVLKHEYVVLEGYKPPKKKKK